MSRKVNLYDNTVVKSFFKTLKVEFVCRLRFRTRREAKVVIAEYIEAFYNQERQHSILGCLSPADYEERPQAA
jgi:putative transposase